MELMHDKNEQETRKSLNRYLGGQLLNAYLDKAVVLTAGKSKSEAKRLIEEYHHNADKKLLTQAADTLDIVKDKEKALKDGASRFGLKTKINYASDADVGSLSEIVTTGMAGVAMAAAVFMLIPPVIFFMAAQKNVIETMAHSGIKD